MAVVLSEKRWRAYHTFFVRLQKPRFSAETFPLARGENRCENDQRAKGSSSSNTVRYIGQSEDSNSVDVQRD